MKKRIYIYIVFINVTTFTVTKEKKKNKKVKKKEGNCKDLLAFKSRELPFDQIRIVFFYLKTREKSGRPYTIYPGLFSRRRENRFSANAPRVSRLHYVAKNFGEKREMEKKRSRS